jgi:protein ImuB
MRRVISLYLPHWPSDRLRRVSKDAPPRDKPLVTANMLGQRRVIASVDATAAQLDLSCGMTVTHAQSLIPDLTVIDATPEEDEAALTRLALWCIKYSPLVTPNPPDGVFIDVAGSAHLFQGEAALINDLCKRLKAEGITARAALADTAGCAWALAWFGEAQIVSPGRSSDAIASLPVACLRLSAATVSSLSDVGIERVGQLASKPRGSLRTRFGGKVLLRLDQALGNANEALPSLLPPEVPRAELRFAEPVGDPEDLKRIIQKLADKLCLDLEARGIGARRLDLVFVRVDNIAQAARIGLSRPYREPKHLAKLLAERLVVVDPGFGIETASLTASWVEALVERQTIGRHVGADGSQHEVSQLIDTLGVRLGENNVFRLTPVESLLPERVTRRVPALHPTEGLAWPKNLPRPARLFLQPEKVEAVAELPDHPPRMFIWRKARHRVAKADGPERIHGEWWISEGETKLVRDYYRVETTDGTRYWLFRDGPTEQGGSWWLHGVGDA